MAGNIIGLNTNGQMPMGNVDNGVEVDGTARNNVIGGPQPTFNIIPHNTISANGNNGVAIDGHAHNITVNNSFIGTNSWDWQHSETATRASISARAPAEPRSARPTRAC